MQFTYRLSLGHGTPCSRLDESAWILGIGGTLTATLMFLKTLPLHDLQMRPVSLLALESCGELLTWQSCQYSEVSLNADAALKGLGYPDWVWATGI